MLRLLRSDFGAKLTKRKIVELFMSGASFEYLVEMYKCKKNVKEEDAQIKINQIIRQAIGTNKE